jgi:hypothetical protein
MRRLARLGPACDLDLDLKKLDLKQNEAKAKEKMVCRSHHPKPSVFHANFRASNVPTMPTKIVSKIISGRTHFSYGPVVRLRD